MAKSICGWSSLLVWHEKIEKKTLVEIINNIKINQYQNYYGMRYGYKVWFNGFEYTKTCCFIHLKQNVKILKILNFQLWCERSRILIKIYFWNINNVLFNSSLNFLKWNANAFECESWCILKNKMHKRNSKFSKSYVLNNDNRLKNMWFLVNLQLI